MENVGTRIKKLRIEKGLSIRGLADKTGFAPSTISRIEKNEAVPDVNTTFKIANYFGVSHDYLLTGIDLEKEKPNIYNIYSSSPHRGTFEYLELISLIDKMTRDELIMAKGIISTLVFKQSLKQKQE